MLFRSVLITFLVYPILRGDSPVLPAITNGDYRRVRPMAAKHKPIAIAAPVKLKAKAMGSML